MSEREEKEERGRKAFEWLLDHPEFVPPTPPVSRAAGGEIECPDCGGAGYGDDGHPESPVERTCITCGGKGRLNAEKWADAAVMATWLALGAWKDGTRDDAFAKDRLRWLYRKAARALSSAPAPEERPNPPSAREVSAMRDLAWRTLNEHDPEVDYEKVAEGLAGYVLHLLAASPSGAGSPVAWERGEPYPTDIAALIGIEWDAKELRKVGGMRHDVARLFAHYTINEASEPVSAELLNLARAYLHLVAAPPAAGREPSEAQRDAARVLIETFAGRTDDAFVCDLVDGPFKRPDGQMLNVGDIRAALGASAQTNTGEGA